MTYTLRQITEPEDYFTGVGREPLPTPLEVLLFVRTHRRTLQQEALQNPSHHRCVLVFNLETTGNVHVDNHVFRFRPGQAAVVLPYQFHHFSHLASEKLMWLFCTFVMRDESFLEPLRDTVVLGDATVARARDELVEAWGHIRGEGAGGLTRDQELQVGLTRLLLALKRVGTLTMGTGKIRSGGVLLQRVNRQLSAWRGRVVTVAGLAAEFGQSESRLRSVFRASAGVPLGQYIHNYRINRAMYLLRRGDQPIAEVAADAGFGSPQSFSRAFRKTTGMSPRAYRARA